MSDGLRDEGSHAIEPLRLRERLDALDQIVPHREGFRFSVLVLCLFLFLLAVGALAYVPFAFIAIIFGGLVVQVRRVRRTRLLRQREAIQSQIRKIDDAQSD